MITDILLILPPLLGATVTEHRPLTSSTSPLDSSPELVSLAEFWEMVEVGLEYSEIGRDFLNTLDLVLDYLRLRYQLLIFFITTSYSPNLFSTHPCFLQSRHHSSLWSEEHLIRLLSPKDYHKLLMGAMK